MKNYVYYEVGKFMEVSKEFLDQRDATILNDDNTESIQFLTSHLITLTEYMIDNKLWTNACSSPKVLQFAIEAKAELMRTRKKLLKLKESINEVVE